MLQTIILHLIFSAYSLNDSMPSNYAGIKIGSTATFYIQDVSNNGTQTYPGFGFVGGLFLNQNIGNSRVGLREELLINNKNFKMNKSDTSIDISVRTISIPIILRYRNSFNKLQFNYNLGLSGEFVVRDVYGLYENNNYVTHSSGFFNLLTFGIPMGFSLDYLTQKGVFSVELRNTFDISYAVNILLSNNERFDVVYLFIGYGFAYPDRKIIRSKEIDNY